jgi:hypothetical protein
MDGISYFTAVCQQTAQLGRLSCRFYDIKLSLELTKQLQNLGFQIIDHPKSSGCCWCKTDEASVTLSWVRATKQNFESLFQTSTKQQKEGPCDALQCWHIAKEKLIALIKQVADKTMELLLQKDLKLWSFLVPCPHLDLESLQFVFELLIPALREKNVQIFWQANVESLVVSFPAK